MIYQKRNNTYSSCTMNSTITNINSNSNNNNNNTTFSANNNLSLQDDVIMNKTIIITNNVFNSSAYFPTPSKASNNSNENVAATSSVANNFSDNNEEDEVADDDCSILSDNSSYNSNTKVRFEPSTINKSKSKSKIIKGRATTRKIKRKKFDESSALLWYTRKEIKDNCKSIIKAAKIHDERQQQQHNEAEHDEEEEDIQILNWFSPQRRKQRSIQKHQMYDILMAIQEYEKSTCVKVPDLLSKLLQRNTHLHSFQNQNPMIL